MNTYNLRITLKLNLKTKDHIHGAKIAIKTMQDQWVKSQGRVVVPISIESAFHDGIHGRLKMEALLNAIQNNTTKKATLLFTDWAHCHVYALEHQKSLQEARQILEDKARTLQEWVLPLAGGFHIAFWQKDIYGAPEFMHAKKQLREMLACDLILQKLVQQDILEGYTSARQQIFTDKNTYLLCAQNDLLEYLAYQVLFSQRSFAFQMYPGKEFASALYLQKRKTISMKSIHVFVSIEKKFLTMR